MKRLVSNGVRHEPRHPPKAAAQSPERGRHMTRRTQIERACIICGSKIVKVHGPQKTCSKTCANKKNALRQNAYYREGKYRRRSYFYDRVKRAAYYQANRDQINARRRARRGIMRECLVCKININHYPAPARCCSIQCQQENRRAIIRRKDAKRRALLVCDLATPKPCLHCALPFVRKHGHQRCCTPECSKKQAIRSAKMRAERRGREYYLKHRDKLLERSRAWRRDNPDKVKLANLKNRAYQRSYYANCRAAYRALRDLNISPEGLDA